MLQDVWISTNLPDGFLWHCEPQVLGADHFLVSKDKEQMSVSDLH